MNQGDALDKNKRMELEPLMQTRPASLLVIFGATGDLAQRMLLPSLLGLEHNGLLAKGFRVVGAARSKLSAEEFRALAREQLGTHRDKHGDTDREALDRLLARLDYRSVDLASNDSMD